MKKMYLLFTLLMLLTLSVFISGCTTTTTVPTTTVTTTQTTTTTIVTTTTTESNAQISFNEESWELGTQPQGISVYHDIIITNSGNAPLTVTDVNPPCGCTIVDRGQYPLTLAPGETHVVNVSFQTGSYSGLITRNIYIASDDPLRPDVSLIFTCNVVPATTST